ncbi:MAG TPA: C4-type zinc ribbon domain-containing protein [Thermoanaerobaculia bacterium]|nr:C4-type zinc ribbon domain-containing protein [Thermoanaerobaculia bacterium]
MTDHLETIVSLQKALDELADASQRLAGIPDWMQELHSQYSEQKAKIDSLEAEAEEAGRQRRLAESTASEAESKLKRYQEQISQVRTQREYGAILQEIDTVKGEIKSLGEEAETAGGRSEEIETELATERESFGDVESRYEEEMKKWEAQKPEVAEKVKALETSVQELKKQLPRPALGLFERVLKHHGGEALAAVHSAERVGKGPAIFHCSACNYRVRPQVVVEIRNMQALVQCENCKRILFLEEDE